MTTPDPIRAALERLIELNDHPDTECAAWNDAVEAARAALAAAPEGEPSDSQAPQPIPVSERLPGAEDCHFSPGAVIGSCWCFNPVEHLGGIAWWSFEPLEWSESATHWLPAHALPLPTPTPAGQEVKL